MKYNFTAADVAKKYPNYGHCAVGWCPECFEIVTMYTGPEGDKFYDNTCNWSVEPKKVLPGVITWHDSVVDVFESKPKKKRRLRRWLEKL